MSFHDAREPRATTCGIRGDLLEKGKAALAYDGKPMSIMFEVVRSDFGETLRTVRQERADAAFGSMRRRAAEAGYLSDEEIAAEITAVRRNE